MIRGYQEFRKKFALGDKSIMRYLSRYGQSPDTMIVACCDSRVDPALILQCDPGELFVVRNVANIVPPYEHDDSHHGTSAALEFGICFLKVKHLVLLGHSQCGGIQALLDKVKLEQNDFISNWVSIIQLNDEMQDVDQSAKMALQQSHQNCLTFPWINHALEQKTLMIHLWFFDIATGQIFMYSQDEKIYKPLDSSF